MSSQPSPRPPSDCSSTCQRIQRAEDEREVMNMVRDYLGNLDAGALAAIPVSLLTLQVNSARDIAAAAVEVARHEATMTADAPEAKLVKEVALVLSTAAMRLAILAMRADASG